MFQPAPAYPHLFGLFASSLGGQTLQQRVMAVPPPRVIHDPGVRPTDFPFSEMVVGGAEDATGTKGARRSCSVALRPTVNVLRNGSRKVTLTCIFLEESLGQSHAVYPTSLEEKITY